MVSLECESFDKKTQTYSGQIYRSSLHMCVHKIIDHTALNITWKKKEPKLFRIYLHQLLSIALFINIQTTPLRYFNEIIDTNVYSIKALSLEMRKLQQFCRRLANLQSSRRYQDAFTSLATA